jgi:two-component sensor histidine kinase
MRLLFVFSFLLSFTLQVLAQNNSCKCISNEKELKQIDALFTQKDYNNIPSLIDKIPTNIAACKLQALCYQLQFFIAKNKIENADSIVDILQRTGMQKNCVEIAQQYHLQLGNYFIKKEKNDDAMQQFILVKELAEQAKDTLYQIKGISRMANLFNKMQQPEKAIEYDYLALTLAKQIDNQKLVLSTYSNMQAHFGVWFDITEDQKYLDSVRKIATPTLQLAKKLNQKFEISQTYSVLSGVAFLEKKYEKGLILCDSGLLFLDKNKEFRQTHSLFTKKCDLYIALKDYKKANQYADSSLRYATLENNVLSLAYIYERMYEIAKLQGNYSNALMYHEKFIKIRDSIRTIEKTEKINELEQKYNKSENEKTIKELSQKKQIATLRNKIYLTAIVAALLAIALIIIYNRQKTLRTKQENMEIEQRLNRARMNPHFFFNTLNSLQTFSIQENKDSKVARYLSKYAKIMRETLESTYKEMNTIEQEVDYLHNYLDIQKLRFPNKFEYTININESIEPNETYIPAMIIQPFIENSIEHGFDMNTNNGKIEIDISEENKSLIVELTDNGSGFTTDKKAKEYPSRATQIIKDRLLLLNKKHKSNATFEIKKGVDNKGTCVRIILPLIHTNESFNN